MSSKRVCRCVLFAILVSLVGGAGGLHAAQPKDNVRPDLLFVFADQMRGSAMGFLGEEPVLAPHLDRLAEQSVVFTHAASNYPVCSPYRAMLLTGQYPHRNKVTGNCPGPPGRFREAYGTVLCQAARWVAEVLFEESAGWKSPAVEPEEGNETLEEAEAVAAQPEEQVS